MSSFILDTSVLLSWILMDEAAAETDALQSRLLEHGAFAPEILTYEVANVLVVGARRGRIPRAIVSEYLQLAASLPITIDRDVNHWRMNAVLQLAQQYELTIYDTAYLELAIRKNLPLATKDKALRRAIESVGLAALPGN